MDQVSLRDYCDEARSFIQSGESDKAIAIARHILSHYPRHVESYRLLGQALLEQGNYQEAAKQFQRVLSADPEDITSRVGLARVHEATGDLGKALWHMRRAFELAPDDPNLRQDLHRLIDARQAEPNKKVGITRPALGRIYARGGLYAKAVQEFQTVLAQEPNRFDVQVGLAEALWRAGQRLEAAEVCYHILQARPYTLKAHLILGAAWLDGPRSEEAESHLRLAQELDPENTVAQSLFGEESPLAPIAVKIERLSEAPTEEVLQPPPGLPEGVATPPGLAAATEWMSEMDEEETTPMSDEERADEEYELPEWLQGVGDDLLEEEARAEASPVTGPSEEESESPDWLRDLVARASESQESTEEPASAEPGEVPDWLQELRPEASEEPQETPPASGKVPDWLAEITQQGPPADTEPQAQEPGEQKAPPTPPSKPEEPAPSVLEPISGAVEESEVPDWLREIAAGEPVPADTAEPAAEAPPSPPEAGEPVTPAEEGRALWEQILAEEGVDLASAEEAPPPEAEGMTAEEWLRSTGEVAAARAETAAPAEPAPTAEAPPEPEEAGLPDWLRELEAPTAEEAEPLTAAPEAAEPVAGQAEAEAGELPDWLRELKEPTPEAEPPVGAPPLEERVEVEVDEEGLPDWLRQPPAEVAAEAPAGEAESATEVPDWLKALESETMPLAEPTAEEPIELETGEMPEWLDEVMAGEPPLAEEWAEPEAAAPPEAGEPKVPDWLRDLREGEEVPAPEAAEAVEAEAPVEEEGEAPPELPDWLRRLREGVPEEAPPTPAEAQVPEEVGAPPVEVPAELEVAQPEEVGPEWLGELVRDEESLAEPGVLQEEVAVEAAAPPPVEYVVAEEVEEPAPAPPEAVEVEAPTPAPPPPAEPGVTRRLEPLRAEDLPEDPSARLAMAQAALNAGDWPEALLIYETLLNVSELLDSVIEDLRTGTSRHPNDAAGYQLLGDACMKDGRLQEALKAYRTALAKL